MKRPTDSERYQYWRRVGIDIGSSDFFAKIPVRLEGANLDEFTDERIEEERKPEIVKAYELLKKRASSKINPSKKSTSSNR